jgi:hypothetical protein
MATTTSTTLSPLVAGAADLARKLAAYKATSNRARGAGGGAPGGGEPQPSGCEFFSQMFEKKIFFFSKICPFSLQYKEKGILV